MNDDVDFDPAKDAANRLKHGLPLNRWPRFDSEPMIVADTRFDYGERRLIAVGRIDGIAHVVTFTRRNGRIRMIGFRRAHQKELRRHGL
jgi:uncharacterized protein